MGPEQNPSVQGGIQCAAVLFCAAVQARRRKLVKIDINPGVGGAPQFAQGTL
jgi:hypothetical protein